jgi:hypothetical protein
MFLIGKIYECIDNHYIRYKFNVNRLIAKNIVRFITLILFSL